MPSGKASDSNSQRQIGLPYQLAALVLIPLFALGCKKVEIEDGRVPENYLHLAKQLEGTYTGSFNRTPGELTIYFEEDRPFVRFSSAQGTDLLDQACQSEIKLLSYVYLKGRDNSELESAVFNFDPGLCRPQIQGRELILTFKKDYTQIDVSVLQERRQRRRCTFDPGAPPRVPPRQRCRWDTVEYKLQGKFKR